MTILLQQQTQEGTKMSAEFDALSTEVDRMVTEVGLAVVKFKSLADEIAAAGGDSAAVVDLTKKLHDAADALDASVNPPVANTA
jgi:hypothetical protein